MQAVSYLAPALAPLAVRLIDKYIFDDQQPAAAPAPQIIQVPAPPMCACRCGQLSGGYESMTQTCSTCAGKTSSSRRSTNRHRLSAKSTVRSSSTGDAYERGKSKSARSTRLLSDSADARSEKKSCKQSTNGNTLMILAENLKKEISHCSKDKTSSRGSKSLGTEKSSCSLKVGKPGSAPGSRKTGKSNHERQRHCSVSKF